MGIASGPPAGSTPSALRLQRDHSALLVIDVQTRLAPHVLAHEALIARCRVLIAAAKGLGVPALLTEHCADRIGLVVAALRAGFDPARIFAKSHFGALDHAEFIELVRSTGRTQIVVTGMEAHVCVLQTTLGLLEHGFQPFVVADAVGSRERRQTDRQLALDRMRAAGCTLVGTETVLFEWARGGDDTAFSDVLTLVKSLE